VTKQSPVLWGVLIVSAIATTISAEEPAKTPEAKRPEKWAQKLDVPGVPNLHEVSDALYRSAQPTTGGMVQLKKKGIRTVINLRSFHSDRDEIGDTGLAYEHIYMKAWHPEYKEVVRFLQIVTDKRRQPVLVHCMHGADRTGFMCAVYRVAVQGWTKEEAAKEMVEGGYNFHGVWANLLEYLDQLDMDALKKKVGIK